MSQYLLAYYGGKKPASPQEGAQHMAKFQAWVGGLGDAVVNPGTPLKMSKTVTSDGVSDSGANRLTGFSIVQADSMEAAVEIANACPHVEMGAVEVAEIMEMPGS